MQIFFLIYFNNFKFFFQFIFNFLIIFVYLIFYFNIIEMKEKKLKIILKLFSIFFNNF